MTEYAMTSRVWDGHDPETVEWCHGIFPDPVIIEAIHGPGAVDPTILSVFGRDGVHYARPGDRIVCRDGQFTVVHADV